MYKISVIYQRLWTKWDDKLLFLSICAIMKMLFIFPTSISFRIVDEFGWYFHAKECTFANYNSFRIIHTLTHKKCTTQNLKYYFVVRGHSIVFDTEYHTLFVILSKYHYQFLVFCVYNPYACSLMIPFLPDFYLAVVPLLLYLTLDGRIVNNLLLIVMLLLSMTDHWLILEKWKKCVYDVHCK